jgi:general secretion pathway protein K
MHPSRLRSQSGSAILTAMLTVTLVTTLAVSALWQQWRTAEQESAERARMQAHWILSGAVDWASLILREDARLSNVDHLSEPWAVPLQEARLSTFLASGPDALSSTDAVPEVFLSGRIIDMQSRLNVRNLVQNGAIDSASQTAFVRLFKLLLLPAAELATMTEQLRLAQLAASNTTEASPDVNVALLPQDVDQLRWLGLSAPSLERLRRFITLLPVPTPVNLNTAPAEVIYAVVTNFEFPNAQQFVTLRNQKHLNALSDGEAQSPVAGVKFNDSQHSVGSRFFEVHCNLRSDEAMTQEISVLQRDGLQIRILSRRSAPYQPVTDAI